MALLDPAAQRCECGTPMILDLPQKDRRGYRYVMFYKISGMPTCTRFWQRRSLPAAVGS